MFHAEGPLPDGGGWAFDEWEPDEFFGGFRETFLAPAMRNIETGQPTVQRLDVRCDSRQLGFA